jgi:hypothetical protein
MLTQLKIIAPPFKKILKNARKIIPRLGQAFIFANGKAV